MKPRPSFTKLAALVAVLILPVSGLLGQPAPPDQPPGPTEVDLIPLNMVDMGTHEVVELLEQLTDKYAIRAQNVPNVQLNFKMKKDDGLTIEEAILVIESLLRNPALDAHRAARNAIELNHELLGLLPSLWRLEGWVLACSHGDQAKLIRSRKAKFRTFYSNV